MKILLEGSRLARARNLGGIDSMWRHLTLALAAQLGPEDELGLLTGFLRPSRTAALTPYARAGCRIHHWWFPPQVFETAGRLGAPVELFTGSADLVHASEPYWPLRGGGRLVVTCHDLMYHHFPQYLPPRWAGRLERGTRSLVPRADLWICVSEFTRQDLIRSFGVPPSRTRVVYSGVDPIFLEAGRRAERETSESREPYYLFLGSLEKKKNLPTLLRAFGLAVARGLATRLCIAGRASWQAAEVRELAAAHPGLGERVDFPGFVPQEEVPALIAGARALILPSRFEGFGLPVIEAMAAGTPVLCSNRGALPEIAGGAARLFDPDGVEDLAELLLEVEEDPGLRERMRRAGQRRAADFHWERTARETLAAYRRALELPA